MKYSSQYFVEDAQPKKVADFMHEMFNDGAEFDYYEDIITVKDGSSRIIADRIFYREFKDCGIVAGFPVPLGYTPAFVSDDTIPLWIDETQQSKD